MTKRRTDPNYDDTLEERDMDREPPPNYDTLKERDMDREPPIFTTRKTTVTKMTKLPEPTAPAVNMTEAQAMVAVIERAARDPNTDIGKMQSLFAMRNELRMQAKSDIAEQREIDFHDAWARAQAAMSRVAADARNDQTRSKYATLGALDAAIRPAYTAEGFSISFDTEACTVADGSAVRIVGYLARRGHTVRRQTEVPIDTKGPRGQDMMTRTHAHKSAITYGRRELLEMLFSLATGKDDDGNAAGGRLNEPIATVSDKQVAELEHLLMSTGSNMPKFLERLGLEALGKLRADKFDEVKKWITDTAEKRKAAIERANAEANALRDKEDAQ